MSWRTSSGAGIPIREERLKSAKTCAFIRSISVLKRTLPGANQRSKMPMATASSPMTFEPM